MQMIKGLTIEEVIDIIIEHKIYIFGHKENMFRLKRVLKFESL